MVATRRPSRLGWLPAMLFGQQLGWAFGASSCTVITVSGVDALDLDGTYEKGSTTGDPFVRAGGTTFYEMYQFTDSDIGGWVIAVSNNVVYRVFDPALHPADITLEWVECDGLYDCNDGAAVLQPVIACEESETLAPTPFELIETPSPSPGPSPAPTAADTEPDVLVCGSDYACATATATVLADALCSTDPCSDADCCDPGGTISQNPDASNDDAEAPSPSPPPTTAENPESGKTGEGENSNITEIVLGVVVTVVSAIVLGGLKMIFCKKNQGNPNPGTTGNDDTLQVPPASIGNRDANIGGNNNANVTVTNVHHHY